MKKIIVFSHLLFSFLSVPAQVLLDSTVIDTLTIRSGLNTAWELVYGSDGWIWYTERIGKISKVNPITKQNILLAVLPDVYENATGAEETGLLGMALHPDFADTPFVFVVYNYLNGSAIKEKLVRYAFSPDTLINQTILLDNINGAVNHNGSRLIITNDRKIIMTIGDAGNSNNAQDLNVKEGKILRMNLDGTIPPDNPLDGKLLWSWGSRNAQGLAFGPNGILYSSEHGPLSDDELNIIIKGRNYGWPFVKGFCDSVSEMQFCNDSNVIEPLFAWTPTIAPAGLEYYSKTEIPEFYNALLLCTLKEQDLRALRLNSSGDSMISEKIYLDNIFGRIRDVCIAPNGDVFIATSNRDGRGQNPFPLLEDDRIIQLKNAALSGNFFQEEEKSFKIYPNPTNGKFKIITSGIKPVKIEIFNVLGKKIYNSQCTGFSDEDFFEVNLSNCSEGIYHVQATIITEDKIYSRIILMKGI